MRILVTGGTGMVGSAILRRLARSNHVVLGPSRCELDLLDETALTGYLGRERPDLIVHCAGRVGGIQANIAAQSQFLAENATMGLNVVRSARRHGVPALLNMASSCMYPRAATNPLREEAILTGALEPTNEGYALAKILTMRMCQYICRENPSLHYKTLVPCNLYGPGDAFDPRRSHLIPSIITKVHVARASGESQVTIWGDGCSRREFMYVDDLADFVHLAVERVSELDELINVGVGRDLTINEYYATVARVLGYQGEFVHDLSQPTGMAQKLLDVTTAESLGWKARTSLEEGIAQSYEYYLSLGN